MIKLVKHNGVVLEPSVDTFDKAAATFGSVLHSKHEGKYYLYYTGSSNIALSGASIGVAVSSDGINFKKKLDPIISYGRQSVTPAVFQIHDKYWMVFSYVPVNESFFNKGRKIAMAVSDDPLGPWKTVKELIKPNFFGWEGHSIDLGPSVSSLGNNKFLIYYSNVHYSAANKFFGPPYWLRKMGILLLKIKDTGKIYSSRWENNPLSNLNGTKGSWNESLFCPGQFAKDNKQYLLPTTSTYSIGWPYKQYIGIIEDTSPFFTAPTFIDILLNGPKEKAAILPSTKGEIALDTPSPIITEKELRVYYSIMDRSDNIWKIALSNYMFV